MGQITGNRKDDKPTVDPVVQGTHRDILTMVTLSERETTLSPRCLGDEQAG